jgi:hypothetical protein
MVIINLQLLTNQLNGVLVKDSKRISKLSMVYGQSGIVISHGKLIWERREEAQVHMDINLYIWPDRKQMVILI